MLKCIANLMVTLGDPSLHRIGLVAVGVLFGMVAAEETQASCGDYLVIGGVDHTMSQSEGSSHADSSQVPVGSPCHGPQCRRSPAAPIQPLPIQSGPSQQERAHLQSLSGFNLPSPFWFLAVETSARSTPGFPFRIERPPHA